MYKKLLLKKVCIASIDRSQNLEGGDTILTTYPANGCSSEESSSENTYVTVRS